MATKTIELEDGQVIVEFDDDTGELLGVSDWHGNEWRKWNGDAIAQEAVDDWMSIHRPDKFERCLAERERIETAKRNGIGCRKCDYTGAYDRDVQTENGPVATMRECECMERRRDIEAENHPDPNAEYTSMRSSGEKGPHEKLVNSLFGFKGVK